MLQRCEFVAQQTDTFLQCLKGTGERNVFSTADFQFSLQLPKSLCVFVYRQKAKVIQKPAEANTAQERMNIHTLWGTGSKNLILKLSSAFCYKTKFWVVYNFI